MQFIGDHLLLIADNAGGGQCSSGGQEKQQGWLTSGRSRWTLATNCRPSVWFGTSSSCPPDADLFSMMYTWCICLHFQTYQVDFNVGLEGLRLLHLQVVGGNHWKWASVNIYEGDPMHWQWHNWHWSLHCPRKFWISAISPLSVTLCSPVPGWVYKSTCTDTSPTLPSCDADDAAHVNMLASKPIIWQRSINWFELIWNLREISS